MFSVYFCNLYGIADMNDTTKTFNHLKGFRITWGNVMAIITIAILIGGFFMDRGRRLEQFDNHQEAMKAMELRLKEVEEWQKTWPTEGKLALDGVQDEKLKEHERRIGVLEK